MFQLYRPVVGAPANRIYWPELGSPVAKIPGIFLFSRFPMTRYACLVIALLLLACSVPLSAQYTTASLGGTISDPSGASIPDARVTVRNLDTGFTQSTQSGATGSFLFSRLPLGSYELRV